LIGLFGALDQHFVTEGFRHAPASVIAPLEYTAFIWGVGVDWFFWSAWPSAHVWTGAALIVACGLYLIWRERVQELEPAGTAASYAL